MVSMAFRDEEGTGGVPGEAVQVAIWALRSTVSNGCLTTKSMAETTKVAMLQLCGLRTGSMLRWFFRTSGVDNEMSPGIVEVKKVIGIK
jgi:hypothetical protein